MRHWWQVGTRNWRAKPVRTLLATASIALGVALVTWVTCCYESVRRSVTDAVVEWIGRAQISVEPVAGRWTLFSDSVAAGLESLPNVNRVARRTIETVLIFPPDVDVQGESRPVPSLRLDLVGLDLPVESDFRNYKLIEGRMIKPGEDRAVMIEELLAREWGLHVGDRVPLWYQGARTPPEPFEIVGLVDRRRVSAYQLPMAWTTIAAVQRLSEFPGKIKAIDLIIADDSEKALADTADAVRKIVRKRDRTLKVSTTRLQLQQLRTAQSQLQFVLMLISCVALLTAFFIILSTMSMGVSERINQLGLLRCVGLTRAQVLALVLVEVVPMSAIGVVAGVPIGIGLQYATMSYVHEYIGQFVLSPLGITLAVAGGFGTAVLGALGPAIRAALVSPIVASRAASQRHSIVVEIAAAAGGAAFLLLHYFINHSITAETPYFIPLALAALVAMYAGYTLIVPLLVVLIGEPAVTAAAALLRIRRQLVADQVGRRPWRSAAVCCGLMVGLSLIVALQVHSESIKAGWEFPRQFPEALIYSWRDVPLDRMRAAAQDPGISAATIADDASCKLVNKRTGFLSVLDPFYRFIAGDPDTFPRLIKLAYLEGNERDALRRLKAGSHVLVTREFSLARRIHLDDKVTLAIGDIEHTFTVAGVVASPAIDIAVSFFNAGGEFQVYAVGSFIGTLDDARRIFARDSARLFLFNFRHADENTAGGYRFSKLHSRPARDQPLPPEPADPVPGAHGHFSTADADPGTTDQQAIADRIKATMGSPSAAFVNSFQLKKSIDDNIDRVTLLLAGIPAVGLIVAALGVANLMMANVASRQRQIAVLRAVGATQWQMIRLVCAEALILGLIGSSLGLVMGLHLGQASTYVTSILSGFQPRFSVPWTMVVTGAALAMLLCLLAGLGPARVASRSNIVSVLQSA